MGVLFVIVWGLCLLLRGSCVIVCGVVFVVVWGLCLLLCEGCVCYCVRVVFVIVWGLCLLLFGGFACYYVEVVFVIVWELCLLLCGGCVCYCVGDCVCYYVGVVFVVVIFVWLPKFNNIVLDDFGEDWGWSFVRCCLCQFEIGALDKGLLDLSVSHFFCPSFCCVSIVFEAH